MSSSPTPPTLLDDWRERRRILSQAAADHGQAEVELRVLDYLIERYGADPEGARPARFPIPHAVEVNERAMLVHHHVGRHIVQGVQSAQEAESRVTSIVRRMHQKDEAAQEEPDLPGSSEEDIGERSVAASIYRRIVRQQDALAVRELAECHPRSAADYALRAWHIYVTQTPGPVLHELEFLLRDPALRNRVLDPLRLHLADPNAVVRLAALKLMGDIGELDDIGLLMDLLALPPCSDEAPDEREIIRATIQKLSEGERWELAYGDTRRRWRRRPLWIYAVLVYIALTAPALVYLYQKVLTDTNERSLTAGFALWAIWTTSVVVVLVVCALLERWIRK